MCQKVIKDKKIHLLSCAKLKLLPVSISLSLSSDKDSSTHDQNETISNLKIIQDSKINPIDENGTLYDETENLEDQNEGKEINSLILKKEESIQNISQQAVSYEMPIAPITLQDKVIVKSEQMISGQIVPPKTELEIPNVKFQCDVCKMGFVHKFNLDAHIKADHQNIHSYKCDQCPNSFRGEYQLGRHKKNVHSGKKYECDICKRKFSARRDRNDHVKQVHEGIKNSICHICNKAFSTNKNMKVHVKVVHHQVREHVCDICKKSFSVPCNLKVHKENVHKEMKDVHCGQCEASFKSDFALRNHIKFSHVKALSYKCKICDKSFPLPTILTKHVQVTHKNVELDCKFCERKFISFKGLEEHSKVVHKGYKRCNTCQKIFPSLEEFRTHNQSEYHKSNQLKQRKSQVTKDKPGYECNSCAGTYLSKKLLQAHFSKCELLGL